MLPEGFDLVIWGHEHDCYTSLIPVAETDTRIYQPGSSVATSFTEGEALQKHIGLLEIMEDASYRLEYIPLKSVREMVLREVDYFIFKEEDNREGPKSEKEIKKSIVDFVNLLIDEANSSRFVLPRKTKWKAAVGQTGNQDLRRPSIQRRGDRSLFQRQSGE